MSTFHGIPFRIRAILRAGGVIAYPTEAVYGIGCDARCDAAIERVLTIKSRQQDKGLILIASDAQQLLHWVATDVVGGRQRFIESVTVAAADRATTYVVPARDDCSRLITGGRDTLAVRVTRHPTAAALCRVAGGPLISTSANVSGQAAITQPQQLRRQFGSEVDGVLPRATGDDTRASRIIDLISGKTLRE